MDFQWNSRVFGADHLRSDLVLANAGALRSLGQRDPGHYGRVVLWFVMVATGVLAGWKLTALT